jgi:hypothetical protein
MRNRVSRATASKMKKRYAIDEEDEDDSDEESLRRQKSPAIVTTPVK